MKKVWKIVLGIVVVLIVALAAVAVWQWDNISALYMGVVYDNEKIEKKIEESKKKLAEELKKEDILDQKIIDGFSKEDEKKIAKGEMSVEEAIEKLFGSDEKAENSNSSDEIETTVNSEDNEPEKTSDKKEDDQSGRNKDKQNSDKSTGNDNKASQNTDNSNQQKDSDQTGQTGGSGKNTSSQKGTDSTQNQGTSNQGSSDSNQSQQTSGNQSNNTSAEGSTSDKQKQLMQDAVQEMYTLKAQFLSRLGSLERTAKKMYIALGQEGMTTENKLKIADQLLPQFTAAEAECDSKVETVLSKLSSDLSEIGADTSIVNSLREQYQNEKQLQKSQYISQYM